MRAAAITFLIVAAAYALGLCPSLYWLDSGELAGAGFELGVAHAPGHPLAALVEKGFMLLPLGDVALRAGLAQLYCGAAAAAIVAWMGERLARQLGAPSSLLGVAAGVLYAGSFAAAFQAIRPEVYALSAMLTLGTVALVWRYRDEREPHLLAWAGLCFGLGLTNHHYLVLVGAAPACLALVRVDRHLGKAALATALGLLLYVYLPLRAAHHPLFDWGHPTSLRSIYWVVSAQSFQKAANGGAEGDLPLLLGALADQLTPLAVVLALAGLYLTARTSPRLAVMLLLLFLGPVAGRLFVSFDAGNPDAFGYLSTGIAALALLCVPIFSVLTRYSRVVPIVALALSLLRGVMVAPQLSLARFHETRDVYAPWLESLPRGVVVSSYFQTTFAIDYLRVVEGARPELSYVPRHFLDQPGLRASLVERDPALAPILGDKDLVWTGLPPLTLEYDLDVPQAMLSTSKTIPIPHEPTELQSRRFALWEATLALDRSCRLHEGVDEAARTLRTLAPDDRFVDDLVARCSSR